MDFAETVEAKYKISKWRPVLKSLSEVADYIRELSDYDVDEEQVENMLGGDIKAVLKEVDINSVKPGPEDGHIASKTKQKKFAKMDAATSPPILVDQGVIIDGHHRWRDLKAKGVKTILIYDVDEA